jgi:HAD superfamily phosphoserine phosphatase-like hydrolase
MKLALFDLDGTLLPFDSDHAFGDYLVARGWADGAEFRRRNDEFFEQYQAERLDIAAYVDFCTAPWRDRPAAESARVRRDFVDEVIRPALHPAALELVDGHRRAGDRLALVTATNEFVTRPIAALLGIGTLIATELDRDGGSHGSDDANDGARDEKGGDASGDGRVNGAIRGTPAFREGKVRRVDDWLAAEGLRLSDFEAQFFYSDSGNDLALLERVSHPVATNPGPALAAVARARGWPILELFA